MEALPLDVLLLVCRYEHNGKACSIEDESAPCDPTETPDVAPDAWTLLLRRHDRGAVRRKRKEAFVRVLLPLAAACTRLRKALRGVLMDSARTESMRKMQFCANAISANLSKQCDIDNLWYFFDAAATHSEYNGFPLVRSRYRDCQKFFARHGREVSMPEEDEYGMEMTTCHCLCHQHRRPGYYFDHARDDWQFSEDPQTDDSDSGLDPELD